MTSDRTQFGEFVTLYGVADMTHYSRDTVLNMFHATDTHRDPKLRVLAIETDETFKKAYNTRVKYVFRKKDITRWYRDRISQ